MKSKVGFISVVVVIMIVALSACSSLSVGSLSPNTTAPTAAPQVALQATQPSSAVASSQGASVGSSEAVAAMQTIYENIYTQVSPSVVNIQVTMQAQATTNQLNPFGFQGNSPQSNIQQALGSGFVWDKQGDIVTNNHVVDGASTINVTFADGTTVPGKLVGHDPDSDLAVVKVDVPADQLVPVQMADSSMVKVGQIAIAIGNPYGLEGTMTVGVVSALGRSLPVTSDTNVNSNSPTYTIPDIIQTDAPINPGNSGGVLLDDQGRVMGVTAAIESASQASAGIGFVIPSNIVQRVVPELIKNGTYTHTWLGISGTTLVPDLATKMNLEANQHGALVVEVTPGGPADKAGLKGSSQQVQINGQSTVVGGDVIVSIDRQTVKTFDDIVAYLANNTEVGQKVTLGILRDGKSQNIDVVLGSRPGANNATASTSSTQANSSGSAWLGVTAGTLTTDMANAMNLPSDQNGVLIEKVQQGSPADQAGLQGSYKPLTSQGSQIMVGGDIIVAIDGSSVTNVSDLKGFLSQAQPGQDVTFTVLRGGSQVDIAVTLGQAPQ